MRLDPWWQVATPHQDIRNKSFSEAVFAADLGDVQNPTAPSDYRDPRLFFTKTYLTEGLKSLLNNILKRLATVRAIPLSSYKPPLAVARHMPCSPSTILCTPTTRFDILTRFKPSWPLTQTFKGLRWPSSSGRKPTPFTAKPPGGPSRNSSASTPLCKNTIANESLLAPMFWSGCCKRPALTSSSLMNCWSTS